MTTWADWLGSTLKSPVLNRARADLEERTHCILAELRRGNQDVALQRAGGIAEHPIPHDLDDAKPDVPVHGTAATSNWRSYDGGLVQSGGLLGLVLVRKRQGRLGSRPWEGGGEKKRTDST